MIAVIDIGTNTINLLVAESKNDSFETLCFDRIPAKLGKGGMQAGLLTPGAMERGVQALETHLETCSKFQISRIKVTATSAVRSASNGHEFVQKVKNSLDLDIEVIDGDREADLIWKGVRYTGLLDQGTGLIMDIGGGSTEFILANKEQVFWKKSYKLGVTRLAERFLAPDPFTPELEAEMKTQLKDDLIELWESISTFPPLRLIGASGSFNSISQMLAGVDNAQLSDVSQVIVKKDYENLSRSIRSATLNQRRQVPGLVEDRVDTIAYSFLLIDLVLSETSIVEVHRSSYALKEGLVSESLVQ